MDENFKGWDENFSTNPGLVQKFKSDHKSLNQNNTVKYVYLIKIKIIKKLKLTIFKFPILIKYYYQIVK